MVLASVGRSCCSDGEIALGSPDKLSLSSSFWESGFDRCTHRCASLNSPGYFCVELEMVGRAGATVGDADLKLKRFCSYLISRLQMLNQT